MRQTCAVKASIRLIGLLAAGLVLAPPVPALAGRAATGADRDAGWGADRPAGWSAGSVAIGSGFASADRSQRVEDVQKRLRRLGYGTGPVDGLFGPLTNAAVRRFQADNGLRVDGIVGPRTLAALRTASYEESRTLALGTGYAKRGGSERVAALQQTLVRDGYRPGPVDGLFGRRTEMAVQRFQAQRGLAPDGIAGLRTLARLAPARQLAGRPSPSGGRTTPAPITQRRPIPRRDHDEAGPGRLLLVTAFGLVAGLLAIALGVAVSRRTRVERYPRGEEVQSPPLQPLAEPLYVEGTSQVDGREFRGVAYWMRGAGDAPVSPFLLVHDEARWGPIAVSLADIRRMLPVADAPGGEPAPSSPLAADSPRHADEGRVRAPAARGERRMAERRATGRRRIRPPAPAGGRFERPGSRAASPDLRGPRERAAASDLRLVGVRVDAAGRGPAEETVVLELRLFAETERRHWETKLPHEQRVPTPASPGDLATGVQALIEERLEEVAAVLRAAGVDVGPDDLRRLPFVVEPTRRLERLLGRRRLAVA